MQMMIVYIKSPVAGINTVSTTAGNGTRRGPPEPSPPTKAACCPPAARGATARGRQLEGGAWVWRASGWHRAGTGRVVGLREADGGGDGEADGGGDGEADGDGGGEGEVDGGGEGGEADGESRKRAREE